MIRSLTVAAVLFVLAGGVASAAQNAPQPPPGNAKCPVCGMFVAKYPDWTGTIVFKDGATVYFDGPKDVFAYYLNPGKYDRRRKRDHIASVFVKDYYSLVFVDGRQAFYVAGSDVHGPMGKELVPFTKKADADDFLRDHQGKKVLRFGEVTGATLKELE